LLNWLIDIKKSLQPATKTRLKANFLLRPWLGVAEPGVAPFGVAKVTFLTRSWKSKALYIKRIKPKVSYTFNKNPLGG